MLQISPDLLKYFKNFCSSPNIIMLFVYMKCRFSLSYRELEEMMIIRGASGFVRQGMEVACLTGLY